MALFRLFVRTQLWSVYFSYYVFEFHLNECASIQEASDDPWVECILGVIDSGCGISPKDQIGVLDRFTTGDEKRRSVRHACYYIISRYLYVVYQDERLTATFSTSTASMFEKDSARSTGIGLRLANLIAQILGRSMCGVHKLFVDVSRHLCVLRLSQIYRCNLRHLQQ